jgi:hypothetical protein
MQNRAELHDQDTFYRSEMILKDSYDSEHQVHLDFLRATNHNIISAKLFLNTAIEPLCHRAFIVSGRFVGGH